MSKFDILLVAILLWGAYTGYRKGLIEGLAGVAGYVLGLLGGMAFYEPLAKYLKTSFGLQEKLGPVVKDMIKLPDTVSQIPIERLSQVALNQELSKINLPETTLIELKKMIVQLSTYQGQPGVESVADGLILLIADIMVLAISFVVITIVIERVVNWLAKTLKNTALPAPLKMFDGSVGAVLGLTKSTISIGLLLVVMLPVLKLQTGSSGLISSLGQVMFDSKIVSACFDVVKGSIL